jgi:DNA-binding NarL/FixJ family response regulator
MHSVFIIASNVFVRESLIRLLGRDKGLRLAGTADWSLTVGEDISQNTPDIVLVCPEPFDSALYLIAEIHKQAPEARILLIGMRDDLETFLRAVHSGAAGYLLASVPGKEIVAAVRHLGRNAVVYPPHLEWAYFHALAANPVTGPSGKDEGMSRITNREWEVAKLIFGGLTNKEIASRLNLSVQTVKTHVHGLLQKTDCGNRADLVRTVRLFSPARGPGNMT